MIAKKLINSFFILLMSSACFGLQAGSDSEISSAGERVVTNPQDSPVVSLEDALSRTYMQNTDLDAQRAQLRQTDETVSQAVSQWRPSVTVQGQQNKSWDFPDHQRRTHKASTGVTTTINQNIYAGGKTIAATRSAESNVLAGRAGLFDQEQKSLLQAVQAFFDVIAKRETVEARKKNEQFLKRTLEQTQARYEVGEVSRTDVAAAEASYAEASAQRVAAEGDFEVSNATFFQVVGSPAGKLAMPSKVLLPLPDDLENAIKTAEAKNPTIKAAFHSLEAAKHQVDVVKAGLLPSVDVSGSNSRVRQSASFQSDARNTDLTVGVTATMPLYSQGIVSSQVRQQYQAVAQLKVQLEGARRSVRQFVTQAWESLIAARKSVEQYIASVKAGKLAVEGVTEEATVGVKTVLDVLEQEKRYIDTQVSLIQAEQALMVASYQVLQAQGQLTAQELVLNVKPYNPEKHYDDVKWAAIQFWEGEDERYVKDKDEAQ
ncbi:TolC family outer membrane protein [Candidatus Bealeia paramacronuclearis]|uniref:TolC family outer membrane protein n=2 Tax=Candidatus Bealeia paramacronuclearis TaxID=1921001 RepID=A0ABZ2C225_9PROT|nr:TolC family outer membrane protein [Candidatus Bealeia paramacronuclearis]